MVLNLGTHVDVTQVKLQRMQHLVKEQRLAAENMQRALMYCVCVLHPAEVFTTRTDPDEHTLLETVMESQQVCSQPVCMYMCALGVCCRISWLGCGRFSTSTPEPMYRPNCHTASVDVIR